ncbi:hypothetical protein RA280_39395 [Cupriavidus sp. CV2]|uniref:hypothetical protein n=1 Tax=Cupriavidus ulmosensis TaxID=3065913 RepID=UPI00296ACF9C|nr:hypothetical protein [Cupriavidus sp. CV2]MDW3687700.1 hypothetical protein [Cupriavidus sp. CV2]
MFHPRRFLGPRNGVFAGFELVRQRLGIKVEIVRRQAGDKNYPYCLPAASGARVKEPLKAAWRFAGIG